MKSFCVLLIAVIYYLDSTDACTCVQSKPEVQFCQSEFTAVLKIGAHHEDSQFKFYNDFTVEQVLRATDKGRKSLASVNRIISSGPCGTFLEEGKEYFIIGSTDTDGYVHVGLCTYHGLWANIKDDVKAGFLGGYKCSTI